MWVAACTRKHLGGNRESEESTSSADGKLNRRAKWTNADATNVHVVYSSLTRGVILRPGDKTDYNIVHYQNFTF